MTAYKRTAEQAEADRIDLELFRLIGAAEAMQAKTGNMKWYGVKTRMVTAKMLVRDLMHKEDVARLAE